MAEVDLEKTIGTNAGKVWKAMSEKPTQSAAELVKSTKLKEKDMHEALGWLAREGKIKCEKKRLITIYSLRE